MFAPQGLDAIVGVFPFRNGRSPIAEDECFLGRRPLLAGSGEHVADAPRQRIGLRAGLCRQGQAEAAQIVILVVIAVPATVVLRKMERQNGPLRMGNRFIGQENRLARLIAPAGTDIDAPGRIVVAVDGKAHRTGHASSGRFGRYKSHRAVSAGD